MKIAVIGGGISGLAAAWEVHNEAEITVYEPGRLGGRILTEPFHGANVECGPDAFLTRVPDGLKLAEEIGLEDLVTPSDGGTLIWWGGRRRPLPDGLVLGVPRKFAPLLRSGLLSPAGLVRAAGDLVLPRSPMPGDTTVWKLIARRFGGEVADRLVDPLVGGIHAGTIKTLSAAATVPQLVEAATRSRSLLIGLRRSAPRGPAGPIFAAPRQGLGQLVDQLVRKLAAAGVRFPSARVESVAADGGGWRLGPDGERFDLVVVAVAAAEAARLLGDGAPAELGRIRTASVAVTTLGYADLALPSGANGILVPRSSGLLTTAWSFASAKWPHWAGPGRTILRVSTGRDGDDRGLRLDDSTLVERLVEETKLVLDTSAVPDTWRVSRWPDSFPQYEVGHLDAVGKIEEQLCRTHPGVAVCGSSYRGSGLPACISSGRKAARMLLEVTRQPR